ncbi:MAG TPA: hypothetical protein VMS81_06545 [Methanomicrobiales archaeon]|jgi:hypothetical protein|nr:hypothetical protein [Methanomicrobiales archaeon]
MQLPRGKFRSVIKGVALNSLIQELAEVRYTGNVTITLKPEVITLVIQRGRYILAEYGPLRGDLAWEAMAALGETIIDAILSDFSEPDLKLALEFNDECLLPSPTPARIPKAPRERPREPPPVERLAERQVEKPVERPVEELVERLVRGSVGRSPEGKAKGPAEIPPSPRVERPAVPAIGPSPGEGKITDGEPAAGEAPVTAQAWTKVDMAQAIAAGSELAGGEIPAPDGYDELALLHMEMSALDDVDVEHIATKIRKNAKGIVKKLHLGHLMTEKEE